MLEGRQRREERLRPPPSAPPSQARAATPAQAIGGVRAAAYAPRAAPSGGFGLRLGDRAVEASAITRQTGPYAATRPLCRSLGAHSGGCLQPRPPCRPSHPPYPYPSPALISKPRLEWMGGCRAWAQPSGGLKSTQYLPPAPRPPPPAPCAQKRCAAGDGRRRRGHVGAAEAPAPC